MKFIVRELDHEFHIVETLTGQNVTPRVVAIFCWGISGANNKMFSHHEAKKYCRLLNQKQLSIDAHYDIMAESVQEAQDVQNGII